MIPANLAPGQRRDLRTGLVMPWFTPSALDEIGAWPLYDQEILEWGGGASSLWWATRAKRVFTIETRSSWCAWIETEARRLGLANIKVIHRPPSTPIFRYIQIPNRCRPDIVVIDATRRMECLVEAITLPRPVTIIFDNWQQDDCFISPEAELLMKPFLGATYPEIHPNHEKHPWQTAIWTLA